MKFIFNRKSNVRSLLAVMVAVFSMLWVSLTAMAAEDEGIAVTVMEWKARNSELRIAGTVAGPILMPRLAPPFQGEMEDGLFANVI